MATFSNSIRTRELVILIVFWLVAVVLLGEVVVRGGNVPSVFGTGVAGLGLAIGALAIAVGSLRARFVGALARPFRIVYGVLVVVVVGVFFFGGAILLALLLARLQ